MGLIGLTDLWKRVNFVIIKLFRICKFEKVAKATPSQYKGGENHGQERVSIKSTSDNSYGGRCGFTCSLLPTKLANLLEQSTSEKLTLLEIIAELAYMAVYPMFIVYSALMLQLGIWTWCYIGICLFPPIAVFYFTIRKKTIAYLKLLLENKPMWNLKAIDEYMELIKTSQDISH